MRRMLTRAGRVSACETPRKLALAVLCLALLVSAASAAAVAAPAAASSNVQHEGAQPHAGAESGAPAEAEHGGRGIVDVIARLVNFAILAGTLVYLLRSPLRTYLTDRSTQIRSDLVTAAEMKATAASQIAEIDRRMKALPRELEMLRAQGAQEIAAEEARIQAAAAAESERLLAQAKREIDLQVKVAERELVAYAADLAVGVASDRIRKSITDEDQQRLVDRYVQQLKPGNQ
jgi:F-type H+-transporting ATPase subunit b